MEFWIGLFAFCLFCIILEHILPNPTNRIVPYVLLFVLWFISAFRYNIGNDYSSYINIFYTTDMEDIYPEITFRVLSVFLRENGFDYQMLFCVYSTLTYLVLWMSIKKYIKDTSTRMLAITLYAISFPLMWYSFSIIRQGLAMVIVLYAIDYIYLRKFKRYVVCILCAASIHTSSILLLLLYWVPRKNQKMKVYFGLLITCICIYFSNILPNFVQNVLEILGLNMYSGYVIIESANNLFRVSILFEIILFFICAYYTKNIGGKFINIYAIYIYGLIVLSFSTVAGRMNLFFEIVYIIILAKLITYINLKYKTQLAYCILIPIFVILLRCMYSDSINPIVEMQEGLSTGNYQYEFNFALVK